MSEAPSQPDKPDRYPWVAMGVVLIGTFMVILDTTIVNVALPQIGVALDRQSGIEWIVTTYLLAVGIAQPPTGWLADRYGRRAVFIGSLALFGLGSLLAAASPNLEALVGARIVQGFGGGAMMPVGMAMMYELFPPDRRGTALGIWGIAAMAGPAFGPVIGGYLVTTVSWHWLFLVNVPIGILGVFAAIRLLRDTGYREHRRFDWVGFGLISVGLITWLTAFGQAESGGWDGPMTVGLLAAGSVILTAFVLWERRVDSPLIHLEMFKVKIFDLTLVVTACTVVVQFGILVFLPLVLQTVRGLSALRVGTMLVPMAVAAAITFPLGGRLTDRIGPRLPVALGSTLLAASAWVLGGLEVDSGIMTIEVALVLQGLGFGLAMMPNSVTGLNALPRRFVAQASAVRQLNVRVAASFGVAVLATVVAMQLGGVSAAGAEVGAATAQDAYNTVFRSVSVLALVAACLALFLPGPSRNRELLADRTREEQDLAIDPV